jgi:hypothetical protein
MIWWLTFGAAAVIGIVALRLNENVAFFIIGAAFGGALHKLLEDDGRW